MTRLSLVGVFCAFCRRYKGITGLSGHDFYDDEGISRPSAPVIQEIGEIKFHQEAGPGYVILEREGPTIVESSH